MRKLPLETLGEGEKGVGAGVPGTEPLAIPGKYISNRSNIYLVSDSD